MKHFGNTMVMWNLKAMQPTKIFSVPGAPLEIRWSLKAGDDWAITATALTSKLWLVKPDANGEWQAKEVASIGDPAKIPLPVDISISADGEGALGQHLHGRQDPLFRPIQPGAARSRPTRSKPASRSTWSPRAGTESASTSPLRCCRIGTRRARTTSSSCAHSTGTARSWRRHSRWTSTRRSSAARII